MATKQQIPVIAARLTEFQAGFENLPTEDAQWIIMNGKDAVDLIVAAVANRAKASAQAVMTILGSIVATFTIPATTEKFVARDKFRVDTWKKTKVKISYLGNNFKEWFLSKIENPFSGSTISSRKLEKNIFDGLILAELGGNEAAETTLTEIYAAMEAQPHGESGNLLNDGCANIFYVNDINSTLRAVMVFWHIDGWSVNADLVEGPGLWFADYHVFSRKPQTN